jgi:hypothetical protein
MNPQNTSFIPKRPTQGKINNRGVRKIYILSYISYVLFFGALISAVAVFLYTYTLHAKINAERTKLTQEQSQFGQSDIESILRLEQLINTAEQKMDVHISLPRIFGAIESSALDTLVLDAFEYKRSDDAAPVLTLGGESSNFNSILFQREVLALNPILAKSSFSKIEIAEAATDANNKSESSVKSPVIKFEISSDIDPSLVNYTPGFTASTSEDVVSSDVEPSSQTTKVDADTVGGIVGDLE